jgi:hypothetical protein
LGGLIKAYARYRKSLAWDTETFAGFVLGTLRLHFGRLVSRTLSRQLAVRQYAKMRHSMFETHLIVPSVDNAQIDIDTAYVPLSLSGGGGSRVPDMTLADQWDGAVLIFGEAGSGKSSLTKKLFRRSCMRVYESPARFRLPVHVELRRIIWPTDDASDKNPGIWLYDELMRKAAEGKGVHNARFVVEAAASTIGLIVLLDGLDEVPQRHLLYATTAIVELARHLSGISTNTTVIITARTQMATSLPREFLSSIDTIYSLEPFTPSDIFEFLYRWPFPTEPLNEAQRIFSTIQEHRTLAEMCTNPLILSMYVAQDQRYKKSQNLNPIRLPDTRTEFYSSVIGELLIYRRGQQLGKITGRTATRKEREELLGRIALDHLYGTDDPANSVSWPAAVSIVRTSAGLETDSEAEQYLSNLAIETGIFTEERPGESLRFMHLTLCEYLAAKEATEGKTPTVEQLATTVADSSAWAFGDARLAEVLVFAVALLKRADRDEALQGLLGWGLQPELILRMVRECQAYVLPVFQQCVDQVVEMLASTERWDEAWFKRLRLVSGCLDDFARSRHADTTAKRNVAWLFATLTTSDPERLNKLFDVWLQINPAEALSYVDKVAVEHDYLADDRLIRAMEQPELIALATARFFDSTNSRATWALLLAESALRSRLVAQTLLREQVHPDKDFGIDRSVSWLNTGVTRGTLYGAVLSVACESFSSVSSAHRRATLARVGILSNITPLQATVSPDLDVFSLVFARFAVIIFMCSLGMSAWTALALDNFLIAGPIIAALGASAIILLRAAPSVVRKGFGLECVMLNIDAESGAYKFGIPDITASCALAISSGRLVCYIYDPKYPSPTLVSGLGLDNRPISPYLRMMDGINFSMLDLRGLPPEEVAPLLLVAGRPVSYIVETDGPALPRTQFPRIWRFLRLALSGSSRKLI